MHWRGKWQPTPVFLPGESQGRGSLVGCHLWGHTESTRLKRLSMYVYTCILICVCVCVCACSRQRKAGRGCGHSSGVVETFLPGSSSGTRAQPVIPRPGALLVPCGHCSLCLPTALQDRTVTRPPFPYGLAPEDNHRARSLHVCGGPWTGALLGVRGGPQADRPAWAVGGVQGPWWAAGG